MSYEALFAIASAFDLENKQLDVQTVFLYGNINKEILSKNPQDKKKV